MPPLNALKWSFLLGFAACLLFWLWSDWALVRAWLLTVLLLVRVEGGIL